MRKIVGIAVAVTLLMSMPIVSVAAPVPAIPSDFNGDGYVDLAIGIPDEDVGGNRDAGAVNVLYGSRTGITSTGNQLWNQDSPGIPGASDDNDDFATHDFGTSVASGDFDRDGFADLAIGAPGDRPTTDVFGSVTIIYGTASGLTADGAQAWTEADLGVPSAGEGRFGFALATGDFDGDGFADLAVGAPSGDVGGGQRSGVVDIIFGGVDGLAASGAMLFSQASPGVPGNPDEIEQFGGTLASGDFDGDGIDDLAVGVPGDWLDRELERGGAVNVLYGTVDGPTAVGAQLWSQDTPGIGGSAYFGDGFGSALAIGDFDRDGYDDMAVGVPLDLIGGFKIGAVGAVNVIYGSAAGLTSTGSKRWHQGTAGVPGSNEYSDVFGAALAAGDFDSDGDDDLAIGVPGEDVGRILNAGAVTVLYGSSAGIRTTGARTFTQDTPGIPGHSEGSDHFGGALAAANYGRSGRADLAVGVDHEKVSGIRSSGAVDVLYGRLSGLSGIGAQSWTQDSPGVLGDLGSGDDIGWSLTP